MGDREDRQLERNLRGADLEKTGKVDEAIKLYEANAAEGFNGNHPYDRLAIIYRKRKQYTDEIRVLERAIEVFEPLSRTSSRADVAPKLAKFRTRLKKAQALAKG